MNSVVLAWFISSNKGRTGLEPTQNLPFPSLIDEIREWQDAAEPTPAVATATNENHTYSAWENKSGIQQGVSTSAPAPPIVKDPLPPLARPQGFV